MQQSPSRHSKPSWLCLALRTLVLLELCLSPLGAPMLPQPSGRHHHLDELTLPLYSPPIHNQGWKISPWIPLPLGQGLQGSNGWEWPILAKLTLQNPITSSSYFTFFLCFFFERLLNSFKTKPSPKTPLSPQHQVGSSRWQPWIFSGFDFTTGKSRPGETVTGISCTYELS